MEKLDLVVIGVLVAGGAYYVASMGKQKPLPPAQNGPATPGSATPPGQTPTQPGPGPAPKGPELPLAQANPHVASIPFATPELDLELSTAGGSVRSATLKHIQESTYLAIQSNDADARKKGAFQLLHPLEDPRTGQPVPAASFAVWPVGSGWTRERAARTDWAHEALPGGGHRFWLDVESGLRLVKTYTPEGLPPAPTDEKSDKRYDFAMTVAVENRSDKAMTVAYALEGPVGVVDQSSDRAVRGQQAAIGLKARGDLDVSTKAATDAVDLERPDLAVSLPSGDDAAGLTFFGLETKYFAAVVLPVSSSPQEVAVRGAVPVFLGRAPTSEEKKDADSLGHQALVTAQSKVLTLEPGQRQEQRYAVYLGPKRKATFEVEKGPYSERGLEQLVDFGWFEFLAILLLAVLRFFHWITGNYGVAIILLTFCVRGALAPLSLWSQKNMLRMQKLGPELNKLKEKYTKKDGSMTPEGQREFAAAQMSMFREHGVNPIGCVGPIFLQLPIFVGLWNALNYSFELREANFVGWISDLSVPDVLFRMGGFTLPFLGTNAFSVLPLVMVVMYYFQSALQPIPADPRAAEQQKMMKYMLPIFGLFMYTMPSGLMIYFITSAGWSMIESKVVKAHLAKTEGVPAPVVVK